MAQKSSRAMSGSDVAQGQRNIFKKSFKDLLSSEPRRSSPPKATALKPGLDGSEIDQLKSTVMQANQLVNAQSKTVTSRKGPRGRGRGTIIAKLLEEKLQRRPEGDHNMRVTRLSSESLPNQPSNDSKDSDVKDETYDQFTDCQSGLNIKLPDVVVCQTGNTNEISKEVYNSTDHVDGSKGGSAGKYPDKGSVVHTGKSETENGSAFLSPESNKDLSETFSVSSDHYSASDTWVSPKHDKNDFTQSSDTIIDQKNPCSSHRSRAVHEMSSKEKCKKPSKRDQRADTNKKSTESKLEVVNTSLSSNLLQSVQRETSPETAARVKKSKKKPRRSDGSETGKSSYETSSKEKRRHKMSAQKDKGASTACQSSVSDLSSNKTKMFKQGKETEEKSSETSDKQSESLVPESADKDSDDNHANVNMCPETTSVQACDVSKKVWALYHTFQTEEVGGQNSSEKSRAFNKYTGSRIQTNSKENAHVSGPPDMAKSSPTDPVEDIGFVCVKEREFPEKIPVKNVDESDSAKQKLPEKQSKGMTVSHRSLPQDVFTETDVKDVLNESNKGPFEILEKNLVLRNKTHQRNAEDENFEGNCKDRYHIKSGHKNKRGKEKSVSNDIRLHQKPEVSKVQGLIDKNNSAQTAASKETGILESAVFKYEGGSSRRRHTSQKTITAACNDEHDLDPCEPCSPEPKAESLNSSDFAASSNADLINDSVDSQSDSEWQANAIYQEHPAPFQHPWHFSGPNPNFYNAKQSNISGPVGNQLYHRKPTQRLWPVNLLLMPARQFAVDREKASAFLQKSSAQVHRMLEYLGHNGDRCEVVVDVGIRACHPPCHNFGSFQASGDPPQTCYEGHDADESAPAPFSPSWWHSTAGYVPPSGLVRTENHVQSHHQYHHHHLGAHPQYPPWFAPGYYSEMYQYPCEGAQPLYSKHSGKVSRKQDKVSSEMAKRSAASADSDGQVQYPTKSHRAEECWELESDSHGQEASCSERNESTKTPRRQQDAGQCNKRPSFGLSSFLTPQFLENKWTSPSSNPGTAKTGSSSLTPQFLENKWTSPSSNPGTAKTGSNMTASSYQRSNFAQSTCSDNDAPIKGTYNTCEPVMQQSRFTPSNDSAYVPTNSSAAQGSSQKSKVSRYPKPVWHGPDAPNWREHLNPLGNNNASLTAMPARNPLETSGERAIKERHGGAAAKMKRRSDSILELGRNRPYHQCATKEPQSVDSDGTSSDSSSAESKRESWLKEFVCRSRSYTEKFVDTHCHLDLLYSRLLLDKYPTFTEFKEQHREYFPKNFDACVAIFCYPRTFRLRDPDHSVLRKIQNDPDVFLSFGCHPKAAADFTKDHLKGLEIALRHPKVVALGEIGLDYSSGFDKLAEEQKEAFVCQLELAVRLKLPLVIHCRDADDDCLDILLKTVPQNHKIHAHCFTRSFDVALRWLEAFPNLWLGLTPIISYGNAVGARQTAARVPLNRILLETDAPYFVPGGPAGLRGSVQLSRPGFALYTAEVIAALRHIPVDQVLKACRQNTRDMYGI